MKCIQISWLAFGLAAGAILPAHAQDDLGIDPGLTDCSGIFDPTGMPSGVDAADEHEFVFVTGDGPDVPQPFVYKCYGGGFAVRFNLVTKVPDWVAEDVTAAESEGTAKRRDNFHPDESLKEFSPALADYKKSGFDRGHQAPSADFSADQELMNHSFVLTNMGPQQGPCFNQGIWKDLEAAVRDLTDTRGRLIVFTGPIYDGKIKTIGDVMKERKSDSTNTSPIAVPDAFFKIVYAPVENRAMAFRISNAKHCDKSFRDEEFVKSIKSIEEVTGFDFFPALSTRDKKFLKAQPAITWNW